MGTDAGPQIYPSEQACKLVGGRGITDFEQEWTEGLQRKKHTKKNEPFVLYEGIVHSRLAPAASLLQDQGDS